MRPFLVLALVLAAVTARPVHGAPAEPVPLPGWRMELVAAAPAVRCPSVVAAAPDGRVFVAEDPMDLTRPAHVPEGRILCIHPDRRITVYARGLHAVFGMQYLEGRLYVLHNPRFTAFEDLGDTAGAREELVDQTNPNPWALDWNDHVPANFKLGMDGFFHVAVGDKGLFHATGRDGRRVDLHGGGIVRIRPDGTGLEVRSTGVRNILDVALTSEDELFTYDNTDENQWMGRVTHMVDGGFYGYPFDFIPRRPYTLWMLADFGAGAATGTLAYTGDALPPGYRDNLFLADFGQRNVRRVVLRRDGGTFVPASDQQLFPDPPADFRPVGITPSADGRAFYVCDWQHRDTKDDAVAGRLWKLSWTGPDHSAPRPAWHLKAALGKAVGVSPAELAAALSHPARDVRLTAQRQLARLGRDAVPVLGQAVRDPARPAWARIHALWALDAVDGAAGVRDEVVRMAAGPDALLARQALRQLGERRAPVAPALVPLLAAADASVRFHAATALGRIGDPRAVDALARAAGQQDLFARHAAFVALARIAGRAPDAWPGIVAHLADPDARIREGVAFAMRDAFDPALADALAGLFASAATPEAARVRSVELLASLHHRPPDWNGEWWAYHPFRMTPPARTNDWAGTATVRGTLAKALEHPSAAVRIAAANGLAQFAVGDAGALLLARHAQERDPAVSAALLAAVATVRPAGAGPLAAGLVREAPADGDLPPAVMALAKSVRGGEVVDALRQKAAAAPASRSGLQSIALLGELAATNAVPDLARIAASGPTPSRKAAVLALGRIGGADVLPRLGALLADPDIPVRIAAIEAIAPWKAAEAVPALAKAWQDPATREAAGAALLRIPDPRALDACLDALGSRSATTRAAGRQAMMALRTNVLAEVMRRAPGLSPAVVGELQQVYRGDPAAIAAGLMALDSRRPDREAFLAFGLANAGNAERGRKVFRDAAGVACIRCHRVQGDGLSVGPDLSGAGAQFDRRALAESILWPSRAVREGYNVVELTLDDGDTLAGMVRGETAEALSLQSAAGEPVTVPKARIRRRTSTAQSLMPEGLEGSLSLDDFADLLAYLQSLRSGT